MIELAEKATAFIAEESTPTTELRDVLQRELDEQDFEFLKEH